MTESVNDFLFGSGAPAAKFLEVGTEHKGQIVAMSMQQERDFATKQPKTWEDGNPIMQAVITIQTDQRDIQIEDDDGQPRIFCSSPKMKDAIRNAARKAGVQKIVPGGMLAVKYTGTDPESKNPANPAKLYAAFYKPPTDEYHEEPPPPEDDYGTEPF